jgi:hypothetical protein
MMDRMIGSSGDRVKSDHFHIWAKEGCWCGAKQCSAFVLSKSNGQFFRDIDALLQHACGSIMQYEECIREAVSGGLCEVHQ